MVKKDGLFQLIILIEVPLNSSYNITYNKGKVNIRMKTKYVRQVREALKETSGRKEMFTDANTKGYRMKLFSIGWRMVDELGYGRDRLDNDDVYMQAYEKHKQKYIQEVQDWLDGQNFNFPVEVVVSGGKLALQVPRFDG